MVIESSIREECAEYRKKARKTEKFRKFSDLIADPVPDIQLENEFRAVELRSTFVLGFEMQTLIHTHIHLFHVSREQKKRVVENLSQEENHDEIYS